MSKKVTLHNLIKSFIEGAVITFIIGILIVTTLHFYNKNQIERQKWKPLVKVDKDIPDVINTRLTLFYKSNDDSSGLSVLAEVSNYDREGVKIVENILTLLDKQLIKTGWKEIDYTELPSRKNYALTIIHSKDKSIVINVKVNDKLYRKMYDAENSDFITSEVFTRLFGVEI